MIRFKNLPIKHKFLFVLMAVNLTTLLMVFAGFLIYDRLGIRRTMVAQTATIADVMAYNCTAALLFDDEKDARETLLFFKTKPSIISARIITEKGTVLADYVRPGLKNAKKPPGIRKEGHYFENGSLNFFKTVDMAGKRIGTVYIQSDMHEMAQITHGHAYIAALGLLFALIFSYLISIRMQRAIVNPILDLEALSRSVSENKDYSVRGSKHGNDEIGSLVGAFNEMLHQIEQQNVSLIHARKTAEGSAQEAMRFASGLSQANLKLENEIRIRKDVEETLRIRVRDEGVGIPEDVDIESTETLGLKLIRNLIRKQLKGEVRFECDKGTDIIAEFGIDHDDVLIHGGPDLTPEGRFPSSRETS